MILAMVMTIAIQASAMSYSQARQQALFLSDKMAYELGLTEAQYDAVYEINLDYIMSVDHSGDVFGVYWKYRNRDLKHVLAGWQYRMFKRYDYFYRPIYFADNVWRYRIYDRYVDRNVYYYSRPTVYISYRGGHRLGHSSWYASRSYSKPSRSVIVNRVNNYQTNVYERNRSFGNADRRSFDSRRFDRSRSVERHNGYGNGRSYGNGASRSRGFERNNGNFERGNGNRSFGHSRPAQTRSNGSSQGDSPFGPRR